ncbi:hypothetical protein GQX74_001480 [Glossina fuscipes]|nr:hypothetical protein GQX74_001480 [Glossina fuscipes]
MSSSTTTTTTTTVMSASSSSPTSTTRTSDCRKFSPNIFNKSKCSHCFRQREEHSAAALECNRGLADLLIVMKKPPICFIKVRKLLTLSYHLQNQRSLSTTTSALKALFFKYYACYTKFTTQQFTHFARSTFTSYH